MPSMQSLHDVFVHELRDLYSAERQLIKALPKMAKHAGSPELADAFTNHLRETEGQVARLEQILDTMGEKAGGVKCKGMEGLLDEGAEVLEMDGEESALDAAMIGAATRVEHYEIAGYTAAISHANAEGNTEAAQMLEATLREEENADRLLRSIAEKNMSNMSAYAQADGDETEMASETTSRRSTNGGRSSKGSAARKRSGSRATTSRRR